MKFELVKNSELSDKILAVLLESGHIRRIDDPLPLHQTTRVHGLVTAPIKGFECCSPKEDSNPYSGNHLHIETNIKSISRDILGITEDQKAWDKPLKEAVKTYGHDEVLSGFYNWAIAWSGSFLGKKPVSMFLKDIESNLNSSTGKRVTSPVLDRVTKRIAYVSDNKVVFTGNYRVRLAQILNENGEELTVKAFEDFYQDVDERGQQWAARDFLQKAEVMISTIKLKHADELASRQALDNALKAAEESAQEEEEEDDEL